MIISTKQLVGTLRELATMIEQGDSFEGTLSYTCLDDRCNRDQFEVAYALRTGNSMGQGGMTIMNAQP